MLLVHFGIYSFCFDLYNLSLVFYTNYIIYQFYDLLDFTIYYLLRDKLTHYLLRGCLWGSPMCVEFVSLMLAYIVMNSRIWCWCILVSICFMIYTMCLCFLYTTYIIYQLYDFLDFTIS